MAMTHSWSDEFALNLFNMKNKVVVITGGNGTLGAAYARTFCLHGAHVIITARNNTTLDEVCASLSDTSGTCEAFCSDVTDRTSIATLVKEVDRKYGHIDVLINI